MCRLPILFAKRISIFINNRTIRQDNHGQNIIFDRQRIIKVALPVHKLLESFHHKFYNLALSLFNS